MILGGCNCGARAQSERVGYSASYLPMSAVLYPAALRSAFAGGTVLQYHASARIINVAGSAWVDLPTVSYFQVSMDNTGTQDSADVTLQTPETWSPYLSTYPDLLKPSNRVFQLSCGVTVGGTQYTARIFRGHISEYSEPHGANGGSIALRLADVREVMTREASTSLNPATVSAWRVYVHAATTAACSGAAETNPLTTACCKNNDTDAIVAASYTNDGVNITRLLERMIPGAPAMRISGNGALISDLDGAGNGEIGGAFTYSDSNCITATRTGGGEQFNAVRTYGTVGGTATTSEVTDATDVAARGKVYWSGGLWGSPSVTLASANTAATEFITAALRGRISLELHLNPFLRPGMRITYSSTRLNLSGTCRVQRVQHQYAVGRARTYLRDLQVVP